jgi:pyridinium-3,5-bisthiocarboxylic acid mononucleotide nickel chelatase
MMLYIDCVGGVAGDMLLSALIDAGASVGEVNDGLTKLGIDGLKVTLDTVTRHELRCTHLNVSWSGQANHHSSHARSYVDIRSMISNAGLPERATTRALASFTRLAEVEGRIHGVHPEDVHFHEVGSEDSIADVVGVALALELLDIDTVHCSPLPLGRGFVRSAHGVLPLPAPATLELLRDVPVEGVDIEKELVTPTGAALVTTLSTSFGKIPTMSIDRIGYGAGGRDLAERPNIVRALIGTATLVDSITRPQVVLIETNLDDCSPELIPDAAAAVTKAGALDVWTSSVMMKKGRPGFIFHAICRQDAVAEVSSAILRETSAIGVRMCTYDRVELERSFISVLIDGQSVSVKIAIHDGVVVNMAPEHDECATAAATLQRPVKEVYAQAIVATRTAVEAREHV